MPDLNNFIAEISHVGPGILLFSLEIMFTVLTSIVKVSFF